jgi:hypothetical protein
MAKVLSKSQNPEEIPSSLVPSAMGQVINSQHLAIQFHTKAQRSAVAQRTDELVRDS